MFLAAAAAADALCAPTAQTAGTPSGERQMEILRPIISIAPLVVCPM
jgi:hypothetical protein